MENLIVLMLVMAVAEIPGTSPGMTETPSPGMTEMPSPGMTEKHEVNQKDALVDRLNGEQDRAWGRLRDESRDGLRDDWREAAGVIAGVTEAEEMDETLLERFEALRVHPLPVNLASRSRLLSCGLFSAYQVASLLDYRARSGDILSGTELSLVDGFDAQTAAALSYFVSFWSESPPGVADTLRGRVRESLEFRSKGPSLKYRMSFGERAEDGIAIRAGPLATVLGAGNPASNDPVFYGVYYGKGHLGKVVAGNFNVRFGQGLAVWTGFVIDDMLSPSAVVRRAGGLSPSWSYTGEGTWRGIGADALLGHVDVSLFAAVEGLGANAGWSWRSGRAGLTAVWPEFGKAPRLSADIRWNPRGIQFFGEIASEPVQGHFAAVGGLLAPIGDHCKTALRLTAIPSAYSHKKNGEYGIRVILSFQAGGYVPLKGRTGFGSSEIRHKGALAVDVEALPVPGGETGRIMEKCKALWQWRISPSLKLETRFQQRWRNYSSERLRFEARTDLGWSDGSWTAAARIHGAWCDGGGILTYAEGGYAGGPLTFTIRGTYFHTRGWASRIYAYERDAPGNFSVPAYYGSGGALTLVAGSRKDWRRCTLKSWARLYIKWKSGGMTPALSLQIALTV